MSTLPPDQIAARIGDGPWRLEDGAIVRDLKLEDFAAAIALVNRVAEVAEAANHHPDILVHGWNGLRITLSTHSEGGVTEADIALAATIDGLVTETRG
jgi:4a-hydroxytetrahydrobiopterin dehydratase